MSKLLELTRNRKLIAYKSHKMSSYWLGVLYISASKCIGVTVGGDGRFFLVVREGGLLSLVLIHSLLALQKFFGTVTCGKAFQFVNCVMLVVLT